MSFELSEAEKGNYPRALMCRALGLSRSGHHAFCTRGPSRRSRRPAVGHLGSCDLRGAGRPLRGAAHRAGATTARCALQQEARGGVDGPAGPTRAATAALAPDDDSSHREPIAPNLLGRNFTAAAPDRVWVADTTYLPVLGGFLFLVVILDHARKVVGWSLSDRLDAELSGEALQRAMARRQPGPGLLFHSDRGSEFAAGTFRRMLAQIGAVQSMSRKGDCWDTQSMMEA